MDKIVWVDVDDQWPESASQHMAEIRGQLPPGSRVAIVAIRLCCISRDKSAQKKILSDRLRDVDAMRKERKKKALVVIRKERKKKADTPTDAVSVPIKPETVARPSNASYLSLVDPMPLAKPLDVND